MKNRIKKLEKMYKGKSFELLIFEKIGENKFQKLNDESVIYTREEIIALQNMNKTQYELKKAEDTQTMIDYYLDKYSEE